LRRGGSARCVDPAALLHELLVHDRDLAAGPPKLMNRASARSGGVAEGDGRVSTPSLPITLTSTAWAGGRRTRRRRSVPGPEVPACRSSPPHDSRPMTCRLWWASPLSSPVRLWWSAPATIVGSQLLQPALVVLVEARLVVMMKTDAVMCIAFTSTAPPVCRFWPPPSRLGVMLTKSMRAGTFMSGAGCGTSSRNLVLGHDDGGSATAARAASKARPAISRLTPSRRVPQGMRASFPPREEATSTGRALRTPRV